MCMYDRVNIASLSALEENHFNLPQLRRSFVGYISILRAPVDDATVQRQDRNLRRWKCYTNCTTVVPFTLDFIKNGLHVLNLLCQGVKNLKAGEMYRSDIFSEHLHSLIISLVKLVKRRDSNHTSGTKWVETLVRGVAEK
jgi:hypothetical protein